LPRGILVADTRRDRLVSGAILIASVGGALAAWLPWHSLVDGVVQVRGCERPEGKVLVTALAVAALVSCYHLLAGGLPLARTLVLATALATGAAGTYLYVMARPESSVHEFLRTALGGTFCPGILVSAVAAVTAFVLAVSSLHRGRTR